MLEASRVARRTAALPPGGEGAVRVLPAASRFSLRVKGVDVPTRSPPLGGEGLVGAPLGELADAARPPSGPPLRSDHLPHEGEGRRVASRFDLVAGLALPINRCVTAGDRTVARLGPDEWLLTGPEADTEAMAAEIGAALAGRFHALIDVSHRNVALEVSGPGAADILNSGCPLDLHPSAFPPGSGTRTLLGKAEIVLLRPGEAPVFRVECWRSFATYVHGFLTEAARDA